MSHCGGAFLLLATVLSAAYRAAALAEVPVPGLLSMIEKPLMARSHAREVTTQDAELIPALGIKKVITQRLDKNFFWSRGENKYVLQPASWSRNRSLSELRFFVSCIIALCGSTLTVTGMMIQKWSYQRPTKSQEIERVGTEKGRYLPWRWTLGLAVFSAGNVVTWVALGMGPNSVLACFNSWNIIFSMVVGPTCFGEEVTQRAKVVAGVLVCGCIAVTITGPRSYRIQTVDSINLLFSDFPFTICSCCCLVVLLSSKVRHYIVKDEQVWSKFATVQVTSMASIFASYAVIFSKCTSMLVHSSVVTGVYQIGRWQFYLWAGATLLCGVLQIHFLNESLSKGDASFVIPAYESMSMVLQLVVGGIFFREYVNFGLLRHFAFWPGVVVVVLALVALTSSRSQGETSKSYKHAGAPKT